MDDLPANYITGEDEVALPALANYFYKKIMQVTFDRVGKRTWDAAHQKEGGSVSEEQNKQIMDVIDKKQREDVRTIVSQMSMIWDGCEKSIHGRIRGIVH